VTTRNVGMVLVIVGSALGAWWLFSRRPAGARPAGSRPTEASERGTVIFDNTPQASDAEPVL